MTCLPVVSLHGLSADSLGTYLSSLGLLSLAKRRWPSVRACWRNARFCLVGGPVTQEEIIEFVGHVGTTSGWTTYQKPWIKAKDADKNAKSSSNTARWRALEAEERTLLTFGTHIALEERVRMNPLLGTGGNAGRRDYAKGWADAVREIAKPHNPDLLASDLSAFLFGGSCMYLGSFQAGSWFGTANKIYNRGNPSAPLGSRRGKRQPYREGELTPWAMALACEGLTFFAGGPSRQLGSRWQPKGAFPFVTVAVAPKDEGEAGRIEAEVWAPIWDRPMTDSELRALFMRGRSELGGRGATSSAEFSVGILGRGVDSGITEFQRFLLMHTTSAQTFESRLATVVSVPNQAEDNATMRAVRTIVQLRNALPPDRKEGTRWRFVGLRGPLDQALVDYSAAERDDRRVEQAWALVDEMFDALAKIDRNRAFRASDVRFRLLPGEWAAALFRENPPDRETRLALAMSSLAGTSACPQFVAYRLGVHNGGPGTRWEFPESVPANRVWSDAALTDNLCLTAERRVMEALRNGNSAPPFDASIHVNLNDIHAWLSGDVDEGRLGLWLDRLCLFDWGGKAHSEAAKGLQRSFRSDRPAIDGALALYALFRPLASRWLFRHVFVESDIQSEATLSCAHLGRIMAMLRRGDVNAAVEVAGAAYRSVGAPLADFDAIPSGTDPDRLLAALVIPARDEQAVPIFRRWRMPTDPKTD